MRLQSRRRRKAAITITPLIDVIFMLLLFFMITSTFLEQPGIKLELPAARAEPVPEPQEYVLSVDRRGTLFLNRQAVALEGLEAEIRRALPKMKDAALVLKADREVSHGLVVRLMDLAKRGGVKKLIIGTKPEN
ncbi:MAG: biopolymer transporter ExbD [Candidatus Aminicenantes bacterium]|nr:biopolymer transporter ExbD [Candidatus Aminicenantes bacterium]